MTAVETLPLEQIVWQHILDLTGQPETATLEFKSDLPVKKGGLHPWHSSGDLDPYARDAIADEIVAFANAWGGTLIIGLDEDRNKPRRCIGPKELPRIGELAERLDAQLRGIIDPPLASLACRSISSPSDADTGVVVIRIARSALAPHGRLNQAAAYVRRGTSAVPMSMRDLQSVFWEARTRVQRIEEARLRADNYLSIDCFAEGQLARLARNSATTGSSATNVSGIFVRISAYPHESLELVGLDTRGVLARILRPDRRSCFDQDLSVPFGDGMIGWRPRPIAHGFEVVSDGPSRWVVRDDGTIEVFGFRPATSVKNMPDGSFVHPNWLVTPIAQVLAMAEVLRREAGRPGVPFEIDCTLIPYATGSFHKDEGMFVDAEGQSALDGPIRIGPFIFSKADSGAEVFAAMEREVWRGLGIPPRAPLEFNLERAVATMQKHLQN